MLKKKENLSIINIIEELGLKTGGLYMKCLNKVKKIILILIFIISVLSIFLPTSFANDDGSESIFSDASDFLEKGKSELGNDFQIDEITKEFIPIGQLLTFIGGGVLVAVATFMGIKYLFAGPEQQAKLKEQLIGVVVSAIVIFGAYGIWETVLKIVQKFD